MTDLPRYHINVFFSAEDDCFIADVPDLKYCSAHGETASEAVRQVEIAVELYVETLVEDGFPIPEARYRPLIYQRVG